MTIDDYLRDTGQTGAQFAGALKISPAQLSRIRRGKARASWDVARAMEDLTGGQLSAPEIMDIAANSNSPSDRRGIEGGS